MVIGSVEASKRSVYATRRIGHNTWRGRTGIASPKSQNKVYGSPRVDVHMGGSRSTWYTATLRYRDFFPLVRNRHPL